MFAYAAFTVLDLILLSVVTTSLLFIVGANIYLTAIERRGFVRPESQAQRLPSLPPSRAHA